MLTSVTVFWCPMAACALQLEALVFHDERQLFWCMREMLDWCRTCDFIVQFCRTSARLYRMDKVADAATVELHTATLSHKQTRLLRHFSCFTISFTNGSTVWRNRSISNLFWALRLIARFHFERQHTVSELLAKMSQHATAQSHAATLSHDEVAQQNCRSDIGLSWQFGFGPVSTGMGEQTNSSTSLDRWPRRPAELDLFGTQLPYKPSHCPWLYLASQAQ